MEDAPNYETAAPLATGGALLSGRDLHGDDRELTVSWMKSLRHSADVCAAHGGPAIFAAAEKILDLLSHIEFLDDKAAALAAQLQAAQAEAERLSAIKNQYLAQLEAELVEASRRLAEEQAVTAEQEREKLELVQALHPLPFPANKPASSEEQYFCLCGPARVALLMWAEPSVWGEGNSLAPAWCDWDGRCYEPTRHVVTAFWPHPKAPNQLPAPAAGEGGEVAGG